MRNKCIVIFIFSVFVALIPTTIFSVDQKEEEIESLFTAWNSSLQSGDPDKVVTNYANDAVLLPTMSKKVRHGREEIKDYFNHFLTLNPRGEINEKNIRIYGDIAVNSGLYTFKIRKSEEEEEIKARFTFVYKKTENEWKIIEHHSSVMPEQE